MPPEDKGQSQIKVLVVDDSAVVRQVLEAVLSQEPDLSVMVASDPLIAQQKMARSRPDVIVLDLEMPRMNGLAFLRKIMATDPIPTVICSGAAAQGTQAALRALEEGAVAIVNKPKLGLRNFLYESGVELTDIVRAAARARVHQRDAALVVSRQQPASSPHPSRPGPGVASKHIIAIGASIGGTEALSEILTVMPKDSPGIVVVQHMPEGFTGAFARRLNQLSQIEVKEAEHGDLIAVGRALIAPGNLHMSVRRRGERFVVELSDGPRISRHRPSVDVLFRSVAQAAGPESLGIILTGMGSDGAQGLLEMKKHGAGTVAQDEASCIVFGMPREAIACGAVDLVLPLARIPAMMASAFRFRSDVPTATPEGSPHSLTAQPATARPEEPGHVRKTPPSPRRQ